MKETSNKYLISALLLGLAFHGSSIFFTLETTYDALIHLFFADHYANSWFEPWNYEWYTGFTVQSYPPLVHQSIGLLSMIGGLKFGMFSVALIAIVLFITGTYRFSLLMTGNKTVAGYASLLAVFCRNLAYFWAITKHCWCLSINACLTRNLSLVKNRQEMVFSNFIISNCCDRDFASCDTHFWNGLFHLSFNRHGNYGCF